MIQNGHNIPFHPRNKDWTCDTGNSPRLSGTRNLCFGIISVKNNTNSVKNIILAITVVFLTPVFLNIHLPVPLKYASLHLKSKNMREKIEQSSLVKTALRSRCNIYHAPSLPNLACLLRQKKKEGTFKRLRVSRYCRSENCDRQHGLTDGSHRFE